MNYTFRTGNILTKTCTTRITPYATRRSYNRFSYFKHLLPTFNPVPSSFKPGSVKIIPAKNLEAITEKNFAKRIAEIEKEQEKKEMAKFNSTQNQNYR